MVGSLDAMSGYGTDSLPDQMMYEIDRQQSPQAEPSLLEMVETALTSLDRATKWSFKGYFLMIEASKSLYRSPHDILLTVYRPHRPRRSR